MRYLEARCLSAIPDAGSQGLQNGSISCVALVLSVPGGVREILAENVLAAWLDLAVASGNRCLMMEYWVYAFISPEGSAAILWSDGTKGPQAAEALKLTANDIAELGNIIDDVIPEPLGGGHNDQKVAAASVKTYLKKHLAELQQLCAEELVEQRYQKFRARSRVAE